LFLQRANQILDLDWVKDASSAGLRAGSTGFRAVFEVGARRMPFAGL
jgi:hypothetical protein